MADWLCRTRIRTVRSMKHPWHTIKTSQSQGACRLRNSWKTLDQTWRTCKVPQSRKSTRPLTNIGKGCQWFQSALNKFDITQDRKRTLGDKIHIFCFYRQPWPDFQSFLSSACFKWTVRVASLMLRRWINSPLLDATDLEAIHCLHWWNISMYLGQVLAMHVPYIYLSYNHSHLPRTWDNHTYLYGGMTSSGSPVTGLNAMQINTDRVTCM